MIEERRSWVESLCYRVRNFFFIICLSGRSNNSSNNTIFSIILPKNHSALKPTQELAGSFLENGKKGEGTTNLRLVARAGWPRWAGDDGPRLVCHSGCGGIGCSELAFRRHRQHVRHPQALIHHGLWLRKLGEGLRSLYHFLRHRRRFDHGSFGRST